MARYTPEFLAALRRRYEKTDQPMMQLAAEFGIGITTLQNLVDKEGWEKRSQRARGIPGAELLLQEAERLAAASPAASAATIAGDEGTAEQEATSTPTLPLAGGGSRPAIAEAGSEQAPPTPDPSPRSPALAGGALPSAIARLEAMALQDIADEEFARQLRGDKRLGAAAKERGARTLASLTQTLRLLAQLRGAAPLEPGQSDDDDVDLDAFRRDLARRIDAFVASRSDGGDAGGDP